MGTDVSVKIGGTAGQGIQTVGRLLALTCHQAGLYVMGINDFESRIRGGHSFFQIRISDRPVRTPNHRINLLVAMDRRSAELHRSEVVRDGLIVSGLPPDQQYDNQITIPFVELAEQAGSPITANTAATGAVLALLGAPLDIFRSVLEKQFADKDRQTSAQNLAAAESGYRAGSTVRFAYSFDWTKNPSPAMLVDGSQAFALGALAADCRFASFYPMSPATGIILHLASYQDTFPLVVEQAEDEISAVNMIIGASFAGARAVTATSGGGFCLMTEGLGFAGIAELPIVIINAQRPGPATGLATRTAQGDLQFVINAAQDDFPLFVFAPGSPEEAFETTARAFTLSEKYQAPAVILTDQFLNDSLFSIEKKVSPPENIRRYIDDGSSSSGPYKRYRLTPSGVSPRCLPSNGRALVMTTGNEHSEDGHLSESAPDRINMVDKRARKQAAMLSEMASPVRLPAESSVLLAGWGSTKGAIAEATEMLRGSGIDAGCVHFCDLWPFPAQDAGRLLGAAEQLFVIEQNSTGQFARLLRQETGLQPAGTVVKYDGRPFYPAEISDAVKRQMR